jgi:hypothetical protein
VWVWVWVYTYLGLAGRLGLCVGVYVQDSPAALVAGDFNVCSLLSKDDGTGYRQLCAAMTPLASIEDGGPALYPQQSFC